MAPAQCLAPSWSAAQRRATAQTRTVLLTNALPLPLPCVAAVLQVQDGASTVFGPILERSAKAERIRSVQLLLRRFQGLFSAPQHISAHAAARDFEQVGCRGLGRQRLSAGTELGCC
jgi:hypothetical protein